jgi:hypothetical protein
MTKDFNKPRRDDDLPSSSRYTPSDNTREERPKSARPRLSRDAVDRAWENGANHQHADYHPRQNTSRPPFQQGRPGPAVGRPQQPYNRPGYGTRPDNYRGPSAPSQNGSGYQRREQGPDGNRRPFNGPSSRGPAFNAGPGGYQRREQGPDGNRRPFNGPSSRGPAGPSYQRPDDNRRPFNGPSSSSRGPVGSSYQRREQELDGNRRPFNETEYRRFSEAPNPGFQHNIQGLENDARRFNDPRNRAPGGRPSNFQNERGPYEQRGPAQPYRGDEGHNQDTRPPRFQPNGPSGPARNDYRSESGPRPFERNERERPKFMHNSRPGAPLSQRDNHNPRWQSRPTAQRSYRSAQRDEAEALREQPYSRPTSERFEGDYERFDSHQNAQRAEPAEYGEKHVTPLPDGRVLKGSRPSQRKQARFWSEVAEETSALIDHTSTTSNQAEAETKADAAEDVHVEKPARPKTRPTAKPKVVKTVKMTHDRGTGGMKSIHGSKAKSLKRKTQGPQVPGTRPSKRGYKWPTSSESGE